MGKRVYLYDGLYAEHDGHQFALISSNGIQDLNTVYLEPSTLQAFFDFVQKTLSLKITVERVTEEVEIHG